MPLLCQHCGQNVEVLTAGPGSPVIKCPLCGDAIAAGVPAPPDLQATVSFKAGDTGTFSPEPEPPSPSKGVPANADLVPTVTPERDTGSYTPEPEQPHPSKMAGMPRRLRGYEILSELGRGGMGAVYLGRQISLNRKVALKVMNPPLAEDPAFVARFTREAYAAAQLVHHNVVQIYDIGAERGLHYFSMEFVPGESLAQVAHKHHHLDPEVAAGYALQAARGLKFAHDLGMIHRDIKPQNLLLNDQGIVKVADLGLVKLAELPDTAHHAPDPSAAETSPAAAGGTASATIAGTALGTPQYMAPEQARDATTVDGRADVYALGCSLYLLLTGGPPFEGNTVGELFVKHATEPVTPPDKKCPRVPRALSDIVCKMLAKNPGDRYAHMGAVIATLEHYLGVARTTAYSPREEEANALEEAVKRFNEATFARLRGQAAIAFEAECALLAGLGVQFRSFSVASGCLGLAVLTPLCYFVIRGVREQTFLFQKVREMLFGSRLGRLASVTVLAAGVLVLYQMGLLWVWLALCLGAAGLALGFCLVVDRGLAAQRRPALEQAERLCRNLRLRSLDEETVRHFVYKYSGRRWEEFYETLFGYEAKLAAREWGQGRAGRTRAKFAAWREPIIAWIDARQQSRRHAREEKHLAAVEAKSLEAAGITRALARRQAKQFAAQLVDEAAQIREAVRQYDTDRGLLKWRVERFRLKARYGQWLDHENVVSFDLKGTVNGVHSLGLESVDGPDLQTYVVREGKLRPDGARDLIIQAARAIGHLHRHGIVHGDIRPGNFIVMRGDGRRLLKLIDLSLARRLLDEGGPRMAQPGRFLGAVDYMAPEKMLRLPVDVRSDIYSLGCTWYYLLAGRSPFAEGTVINRLYKQLREQPPDVRRFNREVLEADLRILGKMLAKKQADRYQTPDELGRDLKAVPLSAPETATVDLSARTPTQPAETVPKPLESRTKMWVMVAAGVLTWAAMIWVALRSGVREPTVRPPTPSPPEPSKPAPAGRSLRPHQTEAPG